MSKFILILAIVTFLPTTFSEPLVCYHCYEKFDTVASVKNLGDEKFGSKLVVCDKNKSNWNRWTCPDNWPICVVVNGTVANRYHEIIHTCAQTNFCSKYVPPMGVHVNHCRECNSTLCNDSVRVPDDPPVKPEPNGPLFTFNINIHLNMKKVEGGL